MDIDILTDDQKQIRVLVQTAKQLISIVTKFNERQFVNIVPGPYFEPVRKKEKRHS